MKPAAVTPTCARCRESKPLEAFGPMGGGRSGHDSYCRPCRKQVIALGFAIHKRPKPYVLGSSWKVETTAEDALDMDEAAVLLLEGLTGLNMSEIARGIQHPGKNGVRDIGRTLGRMRTRVPSRTPECAALRDQIRMFVFRRMNATVLLWPEDRA